MRQHLSLPYSKHSRFILAVIIMTVLSALNTLFAQSVQSGIVYEYDGKSEKKPLANVEIVVNNAGSTVSDAKGQFKLNFRTLKPGDKITVRRCEKLGYEVFNTEAVAQFVITRNDDPITIVMCKSETIKRIRDQYSNIARNRYAAQMEQEEKTLKANVAKGYMSMKEYERRINEIKMNYEEQLEDIENYIERFSHIDLTEISETDKEVLDLINSGNIDEAIRKYDEQNLISTYRSEIKDYRSLSDAEQKIAQAAEQKKSELANLKTTIQRHIDLLYLAGGRDNFRKIVSLLHEVADANPDDLDAQLKYGDIAMEMDNATDAMAYYERAFKAANGNTSEECKVQIKRGAAYYKMNNLDKAMSESMTALHDLDSINALVKDSDMFLSERTQAQRTIIGVFSRQQDHSEALRFLSYSIEMFRVLMEMDSTGHVQGYADVMMMYGKELIALNDTVKAETRMKTAVEIFENLRSISPQKNSATLAYAYNWLGDLYRQQRKFDLAESYLHKSLELYTYARTVYPDLYLSNYAECLQNIGKLYIWTGDYEKSLENLDKADEAYNALAEKNPNMYSDKVGEVHLNKGIVYWYKKDYVEAAYHDSIAVKRFEELHKMSGNAFEMELAQSLYYLGDCNFYLGDYLGANKCYIRASKYYDNPEYKSRRTQVERLSKAKSAPKTAPVLAPKDKLKSNRGHAWTQKQSDLANTRPFDEDDE